MKLNEAIAVDADLVLDLDEFAEKVVVEGNEITAQLDSDKLGELAGNVQYALGLDSVVMYARTSDLPPIRKPGDALMVGAYDWTVLSWEDRDGISEVALQRSR